MKVAYILHDTDATGGAYKSFLPMLYALMKKGVEPLVVVPNSNGLTRELEVKGIPTLVLNYRLNTYPYESSIKDFILWIPRLIARRMVNAIASRQLARQLNGFDLVHSNSSVIDIGARAARLAGLPHIYHFREYSGLKDMRYYPSKKRFYQTITHAICITQGVQEDHQLTHNAEVIYDCIFNEAFNNSQPTTNSHAYLFFAGRLEQNKGIEDLLEAYAKSDQTRPLLVAGAALEDGYRKKLEDKTKQLNIQTKVQFLGSRNDVPELMAAASATIVPSYSEGFGRILPEAMFMHCLTIGRDTTGTKEQFDNGLRLTGAEIGLRFTTTQELTELLNQVFQSAPNHWDDYRERAYTTVSTLYTDTACSEAVMKFYNKIRKQ